MAEYFQERKSDPPTYHIPTEYPKHMYGGQPVTTDDDMKTALANGMVKTRIVNNAQEEVALRAKGWVTDLITLVREPKLPGAVSAGPKEIQTGIAGAEDFTVLEETAQPILDESGAETGEEEVVVRRPRRRR